jgi:hypothetical protein
MGTGSDRNFDEVISTAKDGLSFIRDLILLVLLIGLIAYAWKPLKAFLDNGFVVSKVDVGPIELQQVQQAATQSKTAAQANSSAAYTLGNVNETLTSIVATSTDPAIRKKAGDAVSQVSASLASLQTVDSSLTKSLVAQEGILNHTTPGAPTAQSAAATEGWLYLGKANPAHTAWTSPPQPKTSATSPKFTVGQVITLTDDLYLRGDKNPGQIFNQAPILGAVRSGSSATIQDSQYSPARGGGDFVWVKATVKPPQ